MSRSDETTDIPTLQAEIETLRRSELRLVRAARSLLANYDYCNMPEDESQRWLQLSDACLRSGLVAMPDNKETAPITAYLAKLAAENWPRVILKTGGRM